MYLCDAVGNKGGTASLFIVDVVKHNGTVSSRRWRSSSCRSTVRVFMLTFLDSMVLNLMLLLCVSRRSAWISFFEQKVPFAPLSSRAKTFIEKRLFVSETITGTMESAIFLPLGWTHFLVAVAWTSGGWSVVGSLTVAEVEGLLWLLSFVVATMAECGQLLCFSPHPGTLQTQVSVQASLRWPEPKQF